MGGSSRPEECEGLGIWGPGWDLMQGEAGGEGWDLSCPATEVRGGLETHPPQNL